MAYETVMMYFGIMQVIEIKNKNQEKLRKWRNQDIIKITRGFDCQSILSTHIVNRCIIYLSQPLEL